MEPKQYDVFISYSRKDTAVADRVCAALERQGISYFIDRQGIGGGQEFPEVLAEAIIGCRIMLYMASENSYRSKFTNNEITFAFNEKPKGSILPYIIDGSRLPATQRFIFASVNVRTLEEHPIDTVLMRDLCQLLGREYVAESPAAVGDQTFTVNGVSFKMVKVQGGTFQMGSNDSEADSDEKPAHSVTLSDYYIGETEVTQALWTAVMGNNPSYWKGDNLPVEQVSWNDCQDFIRELNRLTGKNFHLPTEAQWEYAARGGRKSQGCKYSGSSNIGNVAWYDGNSGSKTHPVKSKQANELGLYDMTGNVWEWCQDWYGNYSSGSQTNPTGASSGSYRVCRGGGWYGDARGCRVSVRSSSTPDGRLSSLGLRLAL